MARHFEFVIIFLIGATFGGGLELKNGAYEDFVVKIDDDVPAGDCKKILENLEITLTTASQYLFSALDSRAYLRSSIVVLPPSWPETCSPSSVIPGSGEISDLTVISRGPTQNSLYTQQSLGCGQQGDQIYLNHEQLLKKDQILPRNLIKHFAMYRYGVFEEQGYFNHSIYPICYHDDSKQQTKVTGCSDLPLIDNTICSDPTILYNVSKIVDNKSRSSIMFSAESPNVSMFCDDGNHDKFAPTKHNLMCQRRSVLDVIISHTDFTKSADIALSNTNQITDTTPKIIYKKQLLTRYVFVVENSKDMWQRESWSYLRLAIRLWASYILPDNSEIGLVLADTHAATRALNIVSAAMSSADKFGNNNRDKFYSALPYTPNESTQPGCIFCGIKEAKDMLLERNKVMGSASNVIVVISPGMNVDDNIKNVISDLKKYKMRVATINYPDIIRTNTLRMLAEQTNGVDYTVFEQKLNVDTTLLSTYFELHNVLYDIVHKFYSGSKSDLRLEIHRKEINDDGRSSVTGSFMLDQNIGEPASFTFYTHNTVTPLIKGLKLISPSQHISKIRNDKLIDFKMITLNANISETGTWTYNVEPYSGNPQPHFLQVMATPKSAYVPVVKSSFKIHKNDVNQPIILLTEVKYGNLPVLGAKVEVVVTKPQSNSSSIHKNKFDLLDTGAGDPDITKGDGIYTKYFNAEEWGPGLYTFEVTVTDNGNTAFTTKIKGSGYEPISPFQRVLPKQTIVITSEDILNAGQVSVGRIGDLKAEIIAEDMKARLSWTSPDMGGHTVSRYEIRYGKTINDIIDSFEISTKLWEISGSPFPMPPGSETSFTLDFSQNKELLDKPLYFAVKSYTNIGHDFGSTVSNWVRILVPSPPPPPTVQPTYSSNENSYWPNNNAGGPVDVNPVSPSLTKTLPVGLELILPIVIGIILLIVLLFLYCYFCIIKKRARNSTKSSSLKKDNLSTAITIVPSSSPQNDNTVPPYSENIADAHQIGVPINNYAYEDETKKRYSLVNQQEQQLIEELKQQQQNREMPPNYGGLSVISTRNGHTLSPYNSWSASQLLHEHERRHTPIENMSHDQIHEDMLMNNPHLDMVDHNMTLSPQNMNEMYPPPVPPLPSFNNGYPPNYTIYGVHGPQQIYQSMPRNDQFSTSLQGSMTSVNSGEKKRRNVTMV